MLKELTIDWDASTGFVRTPPQQVFLELTARCNLACVHCPYDYGATGAGHEPDLSPEVLDRLEPWLRRARFVNLNIVGEPLIAPTFDRTVDRLAGSGVEVSFNTNGLRLSAERCDHLVASGVHSVAVSFDGTTWNQRVRGVPWEVVRDRVLTLDAAKRRAGAVVPHIAIAYTLMRSNLEELPMLLDHLLPRVRIEAVHVQPLVVFYESLRGENVYRSAAVDPVIARCRELCATHGTKFNLFRSQFGEDERSVIPESVVHELGPYSATLGCTDPFFEVKVRANGRVDACSFGRSNGMSLLEHDLGEIWNSNWYRRLRLSLASRRFEGVCVSCPFVHGSVAHQLTPIRPGVDHSQSGRLGILH